MSEDIALKPPWIDQDPEGGELSRWRVWLNTLGIEHKVSHFAGPRTPEGAIVSFDEIASHAIEFVGAFESVPGGPQGPRRFTISGGATMTSLKIESVPEDDAYQVEVIEIGGVKPKSAHAILASIVRWVPPAAPTHEAPWDWDDSEDDGGTILRSADGRAIAYVSFDVSVSEAEERGIRALTEAAPQLARLLLEGLDVVTSDLNAVKGGWQAEARALLAQIEERSRG